MIRRTLFLFIFICAGTVMIAQTPNATAIADSLLKPGKHNVALTTYQFPDDIRVMQDSIMQRLQRDSQWAGRNVVVQIEKGDKYVRYLKEFGITSAEFSKLISAFREGKKPVYGDSAEITIVKSKGLLTFKAPGKFGILNFLRINMTQKTISVDDRIMKQEYRKCDIVYAPPLCGVETGFAEIIPQSTNHSGKDAGSVTIGFNKSDKRPAILIGFLTKEEPGTFQAFDPNGFFSITIVD